MRGRLQGIVLLLLGSLLALLALGQVVAGASPRSSEAVQQAAVAKRDMDTWPKPADGLVKRFSLPSHTEQLGLVLSDGRQESDGMKWKWEWEDWRGQIQLSTYARQRDAYLAARGWLDLCSIPCGPLVADGKIMGDVSWHLDTKDTSAAIVLLTRRNVQLMVHLDRDASDGTMRTARTEALRTLTQKLVNVIDRGELTRESSHVECPIIDLDRPIAVTVGDKAVIRLSIESKRGKEVSFRYVTYSKSEDVGSLTERIPYSPTKREAHYTFVARKPGRTKLVVWVSDDIGMVSAIEKIVTVIPEPAPQP